MSEHTPGPWKLSRKNGSRRMRLTGQGWAFFAKVVVRMDHSDCDNQEGLANAHLIAAAPDLLEASEAALRAFDSSNIRIAHKYAGAVGLLRDAILKAKGRQ